MKIYYLGMVPNLLYNFGAAILRAAGDTKGPLIYLSISGVINVMLNLVFVHLFNMNVDGVAIATVTSQAISAVLVIIALMKRQDACHFDVRAMKIDKEALLSIVKIGIPAGLQSSLYSIANIMIQSSVLRVNDILAPGSLYEPVVDGNAAVSNLNGFIYTATNSVCQASVAFTSQNVGAGRYDRVKTVLVDCYAITAAVALVASSLILIFNHPLLALYGITDGEGLAAIAYESAMTKMRCETFPYFILAFMEVGCGVVRGLGKAISSTVISLFGACAFRMIWIATVFRAMQTLSSVYLCLPISWGLTGTIFLVYIGFVLGKIIKTQRPEPEQQAMAVTE
jgi:Na+-driven multidrug efflux pump